jgi:hypothetical protein
MDHFDDVVINSVATSVHYVNGIHDYARTTVVVQLSPTVKVMKATSKRLKATRMPGFKR